MAEPTRSTGEGAEPLTKYCRTCQTHRVESDFHRDSYSPDGLRHVCKICRRRRAKRAIAPRGVDEPAALQGEPDVSPGQTTQPATMGEPAALGDEETVSDMSPADFGKVVLGHDGDIGIELPSPEVGAPGDGAEPAGGMDSPFAAELESPHPNMLGKDEAAPGTHSSSAMRNVIIMDDIVDEPRCVSCKTAVGKRRETEAGVSVGDFCDVCWNWEGLDNQNEVSGE